MLIYTARSGMGIAAARLSHTRQEPKQPLLRLF